MDFNIFLEVHPVYEPSYHSPPIISYGYGDSANWTSRSISESFQVSDVTTLHFYGTEDSVWIKFLNKDPGRDTVVDKGWDKALEIKNITVEGFTNDALQYNGSFMGSPTNYLTFNDVWRYEFTLPIFTWIHKKCNFGWIFV